MPIPPDACQRLRQRGNTGVRGSVLYLVLLALLSDKTEDLAMFAAPVPSSVGRRIFLCILNCLLRLSFLLFTMEWGNSVVDGCEYYSVT